ncbi:MAG: hypothetical protein R3C05_12545 [Pirellulaceae bacterium]
MSMGVQAGDFLDALPTPEPASEREILVASADCKGCRQFRAADRSIASF